MVRVSETGRDLGCRLAGNSLLDVGRVPCAQQGEEDEEEGGLASIATTQVTLFLLCTLELMFNKNGHCSFHH